MEPSLLSGGVAAGLAAAFGAPIGGVLFSLEEASTHWSHDTTWRSLLCSTLAILTLSLCRAVGAGAGAGPGPGRAGFLSLTAPGLISFGSSDGAPPARFYAWELLAFAALAACAGFVAAFLTRAAKALSPRRPKTGAWRVAEATATAFVVVTVAFFAATFLGVCREIPGGDADANDASSAAGGGAGSEIWTPAVAVALRCPPGAFNDLGALLLGLRDDVIAALLSETEEHSVFTPRSVAVALVITVVAMAFACDVSLPAGMFMPTILWGALLGLLFGHGARAFASHVFAASSGGASLNLTAAPGAYAFVGAVAALAGVFRASISLVVIMLEGTGRVGYLVPLLLGVAVANLAGRVVNGPSHYEEQLNAKGVPVLRHHDAAAPSDVRLLPIRPRSRGARRSLRIFPVVTLHPRFPFTV
eukprot:31487-Pelagococcus_subviridis.AAC.4